MKPNEKRQISNDESEKITGGVNGAVLIPSLITKVNTVPLNTDTVCHFPSSAQASDNKNLAKVMSLIPTKPQA